MKVEVPKEMVERYAKEFVEAWEEVYNDLQEHEEARKQADEIINLFFYAIATEAEKQINANIGPMVQEIANSYMYDKSAAELVTWQEEEIERLHNEMKFKLARKTKGANRVVGDLKRELKEKDKLVDELKESLRMAEDRWQKEHFQYLDTRMLLLLSNKKGGRGARLARKVEKLKEKIEEYKNGQVLREQRIYIEELEREVAWLLEDIKQARQTEWNLLGDMDKMSCFADEILQLCIDTCQDMYELYDNIQALEFLANDDSEEVAIKCKKVIQQLREARTKAFDIMDTYLRLMK
jgi:hypothetical protein